MTFIRKSRIITLLFSVTWLLMSLSYTFGTECVCCNHSEPKSECCKKTHVKECCLDSKHFSQNCQCKCFSCGNLVHNELLPKKEYTTARGDDHPSALEQIPSYSHISVNEQNIAYYQYNNLPLKFPSFFLINSSFLL